MASARRQPAPAACAEPGQGNQFRVLPKPVIDLIINNLVRDFDRGNPLVIARALACLAKSCQVAREPALIALVQCTAALRICATNPSLANAKFELAVVEGDDSIVHLTPITVVFKEDSGKVIADCCRPDFEALGGLSQYDGPPAPANLRILNVIACRTWSMSLIKSDFSCLTSLSMLTVHAKGPMQAAWLTPNQLLQLASLEKLSFLAAPVVVAKSLPKYEEDVVAAAASIRGKRVFPSLAFAWTTEGFLDIVHDAHLPRLMCLSIEVPQEHAKDVRVPHAPSLEQLNLRAVLTSDYKGGVPKASHVAVEKTVPIGEDTVARQRAPQLENITVRAMLKWTAGPFTVV
ncbi:hypothetical protein GGF32_008091 [Allomyces javanicus]|nr:hypothetical protein GGF32_008091 [Allomyces javanicus]